MIGKSVRGGQIGRDRVYRDYLLSSTLLGEGRYYELKSVEC